MRMTEENKLSPSRDSLTPKIFKIHTYKKGELIYVVRVSDLYDGTRKRGYLLEITDDTAHQQHLEGIERYNKNLNEELKVKTELIRKLRQG